MPIARWFMLSNQIPKDLLCMALNECGYEIRGITPVALLSVHPVGVISLI